MAVAAGISANIQWTDAIGAATVYAQNLRFSNWTPDVKDIGSEEVAFGTGLVFMFVERTDYTATFDLEAIPPALLPLLQRLKLWLNRGGSAIVNTADSVGSTYTCTKAPKTMIAAPRFDRRTMLYTMSFAMRNTASGTMAAYYNTAAAVGYSLTVAPASLTMVAGQAPTLLTATVTDPSGNPVSLPTTWQSTATAVASVQSTGTNTALVTAGLTAGGACAIIATAGGMSVQVPVAVSVNNAPAGLSVTPSSLAFTQTTYTTGTPQVGISGVPSQTLTAIITNSAGTTLAYAAGALGWTCNNANFKLTDNLNGTCSIQPLAGGQSGVVTCTVTGTGITQTIAVTSVAGVTPPAGYLVPSTSSVVLTAPGQQAAITFTTIDQYGVAIP